MFNHVKMTLQRRTREVTGNPVPSSGNPIQLPPSKRFLPAKSRCMPLQNQDGKLCILACPSKSIAILFYKRNLFPFPSTMKHRDLRWWCRLQQLQISCDRYSERGLTNPLSLYGWHWQQIPHPGGPGKGEWVLHHRHLPQHWWTWITIINQMWW